MPRIHVAVEIDATPERVWAELRQIDRHIEWMHEAVAIRFIGEQTVGVGTEFFCDTKVGPFRLADRMTITEWSPGATMGVRHTGAVTGDGVFSLLPLDQSRTHFTWDERLRFPWWLGGRVGAAIAGRVVLRPIWKRNLRALKTHIESPGT